MFKFGKATYFEVNEQAVRQAPSVSFGEIAYRGDSEPGQLPQQQSNAPVQYGAPSDALPNPQPYEQPPGQQPTYQQGPNQQPYGQGESPSQQDGQQQASGQQGGYSPPDAPPPQSSPPAGGYQPPDTYPPGPTRQ
jgi:LemA protein